MEKHWEKLMGDVRGRLVSVVRSSVLILIIAVFFPLHLKFVYSLLYLRLTIYMWFKNLIMICPQLSVLGFSELFGSKDLEILFRKLKKKKKTFS